MIQWSLYRFPVFIIRERLGNDIKHSFLYGGAEPKCPMCGIPITRGITHESEFTMMKVVKDIFITLCMENLAKLHCENTDCIHGRHFWFFCDINNKKAKDGPVEDHLESRWRLNNLPINWLLTIVDWEYCNWQNMQCISECWWFSGNWAQTNAQVWK